MLSSGLFLSEGSFFRDVYCILDLLIMASAWLNIYYPHGNMMFLVVLRFNLVVSKSTHPLGAPLRIIFNAIVNGVGELTCLYSLITFFMVSPASSPAPIPNRCIQQCHHGATELQKVITKRRRDEKSTASKT